MSVVDKLAPFETKRVKDNSQKWFDGEVLEIIALRDKLFKKFKRNKLRKVIINHGINRIAWLCKKREYFKNKLKENIAKPKDLWKTLKSLGLSKFFSLVQTNATEGNKRLKSDLKSVAQTLAEFYSNFSESLFKNLPNSRNKFDLNSVHQYYKK